MAKWGWIAGIVLVAGAAIAFAMNGRNGDVTGSWRYKMTVVVETPEGIKTGSAVREVHVKEWQPAIDVPEVPNVKKTVRGEAVVVDLGERGKLFALLKGYAYGENHGDSIVYHAFPFEGGYTTTEGILHYSRLKGGKAILTPTQYPLLVTFTDLNDPKTVKLVLEMERDETEGRYPIRYRIVDDRFEELFGQGVNLKEITVEMTDEPVTSKIDLVLLWLNKLEGGYLHGGSTSRNAPLGLHGGNFKRGERL